MHTTAVSRRTLLMGAAASAILLSSASMPAAALASPAASIKAQPLFWHDGPLHSMFARGHLDPELFLEIARRDADDYLCDHTEDPKFADWGNEKEVAAAWDEVDVRHQHSRWVTYDPASYDHHTRQMEGIARILTAGPDGYPIDYDGDDACLVTCAPDAEGAFPITIIASGLEA